MKPSSGTMDAAVMLSTSRWDYAEFQTLPAIPSQGPGPSAVLIALLVIMSLIGVGCNLLLALGIYRVNAISCHLSRSSGWTLLCLNKLLLNILSICLVNLWEAIAILYGQYFYSEAFCHFSTFFTTCLPPMSSWNVVLMAVHQFVVFVSWSCRCMMGAGSVTPRTRLVINISLPLLVWIVVVLIYGPILHHIAEIKFEYRHGIDNNQEAEPVCQATGRSVLHIEQAFGVFAVPSYYGVFLLVTLFVTKCVSGRSFPPAKAARASDALCPPLHPHPLLREETARLTDIHATAASAQDHQTVAPLPLATSVSSDITVETVTITCVLLISVIIFCGPFGVLALLELRVIAPWFTMYALAWLLLQPIAEPIVILAVMAYFRGRSLFRQIFRARPPATSTT